MSTATTSSRETLSINLEVSLSSCKLIARCERDCARDTEGTERLSHAFHEAGASALFEVSQRTMGDHDIGRKPKLPCRISIAHSAMYEAVSPR